MKMQLSYIGFSAMLIMLPLAANAETPVKAGACAVLKAEDLTALLGGKPGSESHKGACRWAVPGSKAALITSKFPETGMKAEMAYETAHRNAASGGSINDLKKLGDKAFAHIGQSGVSLIVIKGGNLLQMQYRTEQAGTTKDLDALIPVAKKAIESY